MLNTHSDERISQRRNNSVMRYFTLIMALVYLGLGIFLFVMPDGLLTIGRTPRQILGGLFVLYGLIRFVRTIRLFFPKRHDSISR